ncbi:MAG TPA: ATP-binding protein, partial [Candidatus Sulfotelmatobacter sp.]|nr:ATP-binding protein [Candidatus Sulfotelmatobacter sp.]
VDGQSRPLNPLIRDEVYRIDRSALVDAFRYSGSPTVEMEIQYQDNLKVSVRDEGRGFNDQALVSDPKRRSALIGMRDQAVEMGAQFQVWSSTGAGTEVVLTVPGHIAFQHEDNPKGL